MKKICQEINCEGTVNGSSFSDFSEHFGNQTCNWLGAKVNI